ncbi:hypothetical protein SDC9_202736 [bioreactor metagenome]|uniref:Uncharacterized protein n=1 Tax=bioreactor metagenome TaxID=1076179 RepID=A0A645IV89_9ZZZZ
MPEGTRAVPHQQTNSRKILPETLDLCADGIDFTDKRGVSLIFIGDQRAAQF